VLQREVQGDDDDKKPLQQRAGFVDGCVHEYNGVMVDGVNGDAYVLADQLFDGHSHITVPSLCVVLMLMI
jgi:hypothetical protein